MILTETTTVGGCMRLETIPKRETRRARRDRRSTASLGTRTEFIRNSQIKELLFENCIDCGKMAAIPQGAFAACKVHYNEERAISMSAMEGKEKAGKESLFNSRPPLEGWELTPLKYNSKLMNSIWGLYNRYSVHNFKKNTDAKEGACGGVAVAIWGAILENHPPNAAAAAAVQKVPGS
ncbi:PREDICTED: uncharacterized protein LOC106745534 [Dinoponera quadriceps]|uniref:Uncharacterized protein LOC106745534 n=1 Tax=Dinoponera quadriceps TaxID=609295 RepID=A0A6P3XEY6_DINQU|nr:PREDICTED: uncharacterized protein LOC106745534 [Dinoponera quadriceps]